MCTAITVKTAEGHVIYGRTMEFAIPLQSNILVIPRGMDFVGSSPIEGVDGLKWRSRYACAGPNFANASLLVDGVNEAGLSVGALYFPDFAEYQEVDKATAGGSVAVFELTTFLLSSCANVEEATAALREVRVNKAGFAPWRGFLPPLHFLVTDRSGRCLVVEHIKGELHLFENPIGAMTNSPPFDWHLLNMRNYVTMSPDSVHGATLGRFEIKGPGQGSGMIGLPGDFTPPSRLVRAAIFSGASQPAADDESGVAQMFHLLNHFDMPVGSIRATEGFDLKTHEALLKLELELWEYTQWTVACNLAEGSVHMHTYGNRQIVEVRLSDFDPEAAEITTVPLTGSGLPYRIPTLRVTRELLSEAGA